MYFKVLAKCGHVGKNNYILKWFYVKAESGVDAARIVRNKPRVKHHHKFAIKDVKKIDFEEYINGLKTMASDPYFNVHNSRDQRLFKCIDKDDLYREVEDKGYKKERNGQRLKYELLTKEWNRIMQGGMFYDK